MATDSSVLAWRIPGTGEPGGLPSMGSHRVGHDWSDLAAAAKRGTLVCPKAALSWFTLLCFPSPPGALPCHLWTLVHPQNIHTEGRTLAIYGKGHPNLLLTSCRTLDKSSCAHGLKYQKKNRVDLSTAMFLRWPQFSIWMQNANNTCPPLPLPQLLWR